MEALYLGRKGHEGPESFGFTLRHIQWLEGKRKEKLDL